MKEHKFLDTLKEHFNVPTDKALGQQLGFSSDYLSDVRTGRHPVTAAFEIAVLEATNWHLWEMRSKMRTA